MAATCALAAGILCMGAAQAQTSHRHHENSATRKYRLAHVMQDTYTHKVELAGGGGFLRFEPGQYLRRDNQIDWATSGAYYFNPAYSLVADIRGHFGDATLANATIVNGVYTSTYGLHPLIDEYTFMAGPQWRFYRKEKYAVGAHVLAGLARGEFDGGTHGIPATDVGLWPTSSAFASSVGVNLDYNLYPNLALRVTPYGIYTNFGSANQINKGVNAQLVFRFGRQ
jgi:hypothetical protein